VQKLWSCGFGLSATQSDPHQIELNDIFKFTTGAALAPRNCDAVSRMRATISLARRASATVRRVASDASDYSAQHDQANANRFHRSRRGPPERSFG
jgi:hypothetical protein